MTEKAYTTFQISKFCNVNHRTVLYWINKNKVKAFRTPGGHSRVREADLREFLVKHDIPLPTELRNEKNHVLIVEDEVMMLDLLEQALMQDKELACSVKVSKCTSGIDALLLMGKDPVDLIILDVFMPHLDGYEVCRRIRRNTATKDVEILAVSGNMTDEVRNKIMSCGADDCLAKPFVIADLQAKVRAMLGA
jgi:excisionase family DNA binding protein